MKKLILALALFFTSPALAQWQVPVNTIPYGRGPGVSGFGSVANTGAGSGCLINTTPPTFGSCLVNPFTGLMVFSNTTDITIPSPSSKPLNGAVVLSNGGMSIFGGLFVNGGDAYFGNGANNTGVLGSGQVVLNVNGANAGAIGSAGGGCLDFDVGTTQIQTMTFGNSSCVLNGVGGYDPTPMWKSNANRGWRFYSDIRTTDAFKISDPATGTGLSLFGPSSGTSSGTSLVGQTTGGAGVWGIGHVSAILGGAYDPTALIYSATNAYRFNGLTAGWFQSSANGTVSIGAFGQYPGVTSNTAASAGNIGEFVSATVLAGSAVSLVNGTAKDVTTISLTAGNWMVYGNVAFNPVGTTTTSYTQAWISTTANTLPTTPNSGGTTALGVANPAGSGPILSAGMIRLSLSGTTTVSLGAFANFAVSTETAYGFIGAHRIN